MKLINWGRRVANFERNRSKERSVDFHLNHLHSEVTEAWEALRDNPDPRFYWMDGDKPEGFGPELADVVLVAAFIAHKTGIDLDAEMERKMRYNEGKRAKK